MNDNHGTCRTCKYNSPDNGRCLQLQAYTESRSEWVFPPQDFWCRYFATLDDAVAVAPQSPETSISAAARDVLAERQRQIDVEGWTPEHDDAHGYGDLARAAACYALTIREWRFRIDGALNVLEYLWPWSLEWWKPTTRRRDLVKAAALILAEIERIDREEARAK